MDNNKIGAVLVFICILLAFVTFSFNSMLKEQTEAECECVKNACPHEQNTPWQIYTSIIILSFLGALGLYLFFFDKSHKEVAQALQNQKQVNLKEEKFSILLQGLSEEEKMVVKAVNEQDGISQQTLRLRTGLHKSKLTIILEGLEKKDLITRETRGKSKHVYIKFSL